MEERRRDGGGDHVGDGAMRWLSEISLQPYWLEECGLRRSCATLQKMVKAISWELHRGQDCSSLVLKLFGILRAAPKMTLRCERHARTLSSMRVDRCGHWTAVHVGLDGRLRICEARSTPKAIVASQAW